MYARAIYNSNNDKESSLPNIIIIIIVDHTRTLLILITYLTI